MDMREWRRWKASRMAPSEARADDLMARRRTGSTAGAVVEVARSMRDAMEDSAAAAEEEGFEPISAPAAAAVVRWPAKEETVGRGMAAIRGDTRTRGGVCFSLQVWNGTTGADGHG